MKAFLMATSVGMFTLAGIWIADRYAYRCVILENMLRFCRSVRMQSVMFARPLVQQCTQATDMDPAIQRMLHGYVQYLEAGESAEEAWNMAMHEHIACHSRRYGMTTEDLAVLAQVGGAMHGFLAAQQEGLNACQTELERLLAQAQGYRARYATLYAKLGLLAGIAAAIVIW